MTRECNDVLDGTCTSPAYQREGAAWWLCEKHWSEMEAILNWASAPPDDFTSTAEQKVNRRKRSEQFVEGLTGV